MRRSLRLLLIIVPLVVLILMLAGPWKPWQGNNRGVVLNQIENVDRIVLVDSYHTAELNTKDGSWYLFGTEQVSPVAVENLLIAASRLEVSSIVSRESLAESGESTDLTREITYFRGDKVLLSYGLNVVSGKYLVHPANSENAYYVALPGYPGLDLDRVFSATPDHYREHLLIDLKPSDISAIDIELASGEAFRFTQDKEGGIQCDPANEKTILPEGKPNELAVKLLFSYFTSIRYEQRAGLTADSITATEAPYLPKARIGVLSFNGEYHSLEVFSYHEMPDSEPHLFRALVLYNDEPDALFVNYIYLDVLMRGLSHYFGEK
ncbi:MAG: hypothetical protein U9R49_02430 [Bacteroidota bacterium]|nr:hypothetical protein [Bacteroidota bacterium]